MWWLGALICDLCNSHGQRAPPSRALRQEWGVGNAAAWARERVNDTCLDHWLYIEQVWTNGSQWSYLLIQPNTSEALNMSALTTPPPYPQLIPNLGLNASQQLANHVVFFFVFFSLLILSFISDTAALLKWALCKKKRPAEAISLSGWTWVPRFC